MKSAKPFKIKFISNSLLFNIINRDVQEAQKFSFILYDFCMQNNEWYHSIDLSQQTKLLSNDDEIQKQNITDKTLQLQLPDNKVELYKKRKRMFNIMLPFSEVSQEFLDLLKKFVYQCEDLDIITQEDEKSGEQANYVQTFPLQEMCKCWDEETFLENFRSFLKNNQEVISDHLFELKNFKAALNFFAILKRAKTTEVYVLCDDFKEFLNKYDYMTSFFEKISDQSNKHQIYPNEIIPGMMYLGKDKHCSSLDILKDVGITHIINMTKEVPNYFENNVEANIKYMKNPIEDENGSDILKFFQETYNHIISIIGEKYYLKKIEETNQSNINAKLKSHLVTTYSEPSSESIINQEDRDFTNISTTAEENEVIKTNSIINYNNDNNNIIKPKILIHCAHGKSRSASIVIMFLMRSLKWSYQEAHDFVKFRRECIEPNFGFQKQLEQFELNNWEFA